MTYKIKCAHCGKEFEATSEKRKFCCRDCGYLHHLEKNRAKKAARLAAMVKTCEWCGAEFKPKKGNQIYCQPGCAEKGRNARLKEERQQQRATATCVICGKPTNRARTIKYCSKECYIEGRIKKAEKKPKKPVLSISEINRRALAEHLSYGEYVMKYGV